jgi:hypothetical protein
MAVAPRFFGGLIAFGGFVDVLPGAQKTRNAFKYAVHPMDGDTISKKVARVASEIFRCAGTVALGMGSIVMGLQMITMGAQLGFFASALSGVRLAIPYIAGGVACFAIGALSSIHGGPAYRPPREPAPVV